MSRKTLLPPQTPSSSFDPPYAHYEYLRDVEVARASLAHDQRALDERLGVLVRKRSAAIERGWYAGEPNQSIAS